MTCMFVPMALLQLFVCGNKPLWSGSFKLGVIVPFDNSHACVLASTSFEAPIMLVGLYNVPCCYLTVLYFIQRHSFGSGGALLSVSCSFDGDAIDGVTCNPFDEPVI